MRIIRQGDQRISKILGKREISGKLQYRLSRYALLGQVGERFFVRNVFTGMNAELTAGEWKCLQEVSGSQTDGERLLQNKMEDLVRQGVLLSEEQDELKQFEAVSVILSNLTGTPKGINNYVILPTLACNARCVYCYEMGMPVSTMSLETAERVAEFIARTKSAGEINVTWFGGEPLTARPVISKICALLREKGIGYRSVMVTNATLVTEEVAKEAATDWHVKRVQVSVDGKRKDYEERKLYYAPEKHNYDTLIKAIHHLLDAGVDVILRCNYDGDNLRGMKEFLDEMREEFGNSEKLFLYFGMLYQEQKTEKCIETYRKVFDLRRYLDRTGMHYQKPDRDEFRFKVNYCMADAPGNSVVIHPDGKLNHCEELCAKMEMGSIFEDDFKFTMMSGTKKAHQDCRECPFLPECKPFRRNQCPDWFPYCREFKEIESEYVFEKIATSDTDGMRKEPERKER